MTRPLLAATLAAGLVLPAGLATAAPASTLAPDVVAWWSATHRDDRVPSVSPPDVGPGDLYVAGANATPPPAGLEALGPTGPVALTGLHFSLPAGSSVASLTLSLTGTAPPAVSLTACRALQPFTAVHGGRWTDVPAYDCTTAGTARLDGDRLVLDGLDALRDGRELSLVLVPGPLDRVVLSAPDARTLAVTAPPATPASAPAAAPPAAATPLPPSRVLAPPPSAPALALTSPQVQARSPLAGPAAPPVLAAPVVRPATPAAAEVPGRPWPALLATLLLALGAFVPLVRPTARPSGAAERGVGRFRSERSGSAPDLA